MSNLVLEDETNVATLILLPAADDRELSAWGWACASYAQAFDTVTVSSNPLEARRETYQAVIVVQPDFWPASLWEAIAPARRPGLIVERLEAPTPDILAQILKARVVHEVRFAESALRNAAADLLSEWLVGLHARGDGELQPYDLTAFRVGRINAAKILSYASPASIEALRNLNPNMFIMVRAIINFNNDGKAQRVTPREFFDQTYQNLDRLFAADPNLKYVEIHNEPNLVIEGMTGAWQNGTDWAEWFLEVKRLYSERWPDKLYGFPGLSPGPDLPGVRRDHQVFLREAFLSVVAADWVGVHAYWQNEREMLDEAHGMGFRLYRRLFPDQLLLITEFGNPVEPKPVVGAQYVRYYSQLARERGVGGAFAYISSISDRRESARWGWMRDDGSDVGIAPVVGSR